MNYAQVDHLIDYFATLEKSKLIDLAELEENIFKNCTQNFLSGNQKILIVSAINRLKTNLQKWDEKWGNRLDDATCPDCERNYLRDERLEIMTYRNLSYQAQEIIEFLNDKPRKQWIIQARRYSEELAGELSVCVNDDADYFLYYFLRMN